MSRELSLEILTDAGVQQVVVARRKTLVWVATRVVDHAEGFAKVAADVDDEEVVKIARAGLPAAFCQNMNKAFTGVEIAERLIESAEMLLSTVVIAEEAYAKENASEKDRLAAEAAEALEAEANRLQDEKDARLAAEAGRREAKLMREEADRVAAEKLAREQKEAAEKLEADRKAKAEAEAAVDQKNAESEPSKAPNEPLAQPELEALPIQSSGIPKGIVGDLLKGNIKTVGQLILLSEAQEGDLSIISGVGPSSSAKIAEALEALQSRVSESE